MVIPQEDALLHLSGWHADGTRIKSIIQMTQGTVSSSIVGKIVQVEPLLVIAQTRRDSPEGKLRVDLSATTGWEYFELAELAEVVARVGSVEPLRERPVLAAALPGGFMLFLAPVDRSVRPQRCP